MSGVAIAGKAGAGKNAFARVLGEELVRLGLWPVEVNFAQGVKDELWETRGMRKEDEGGRDALLEIGHGRRQEQPDYWVDAMAKRLGSLIPFGITPIITDLRYLNEMVYARQAGFVTVRVDATRLDRMAALSARGEDPYFCDSDHESETALDEASFDVRFLNRHDVWGELSAYSAHAADMLLGVAEQVA